MKTHSELGSLNDEELERYALDLLDREPGREQSERYFTISYPDATDYTRDRHK